MKRIFIIMVVGMMSFLSSNGQTTGNVYQLPPDSIANGSSILNNMAGRDSIPSHIGQKSSQGTTQNINQRTKTITFGTSTSPNFGVVPNTPNLTPDLPDITPTLPVFPNTLDMPTSAPMMPTPVTPATPGISHPSGIPNTPGTPILPNSN